MRNKGRVRGLVLMLRIFGWLLVVLQVFTAFMSIVGIVRDGASVVYYIQNLIHAGFWLLIGIVLLIVAGAVKKKHVNAGTWK